jgi:hypothetical protein
LDETIWSLTSPRVKRISGSKNFRSPPQKDFCNNIGTNRTRREVCYSVAIGGKADVALRSISVANDPTETLAHWSVLALLLTVKSGKAPTAPTHTATLDRSVLGCPGYLLRCTRRCRAPFILLAV